MNITSKDKNGGYLYYYLRKNRWLIVLFFVSFFFVILFGLVPRLKDESKRHFYVLSFEWCDVLDMVNSLGLDLETGLNKLKEAGVTAISLTECNYKNLSYYGCSLTTASELFSGFVPKGIKESDIVLVVPKKYRYSCRKWLFLKFGRENVSMFEVGNQVAFVLKDLPYKQVELVGFFFDEKAIKLIKKNEFLLILRPYSFPALSRMSVRNYAQAIAKLKPNVVLPAGEMIVGFPDYIADFTSVLKKQKVIGGIAEFSRQRGLGSFVLGMYPYVVPVHSISQDEIFLFRLTPKAAVYRFVRALIERTQNILYIRPFWNYSDSSLKRGLLLAKDVDDLIKKRRVSGLKFKNGVINVLKDRQQNFFVKFFTGIIIGIVFVLILKSLLFYFTGNNLLFNVRFKEYSFVVLAIFIGGVIGILSVFLNVFYKAEGLLVATLFATLASLVAMPDRRYKLSVYRVILGFFIALLGGLVIASLYGIPKYMFKLLYFVGVKLSLILPILLVALISFWRRAHSERLSELMFRGVKWFELFLLGIFLAAFAILLLRSGNFGLLPIPALEEKIRLFLELIFGVRPRTKEIVIGYPSVVMWFYLLKKGWLKRYRVAFRIFGTIAFVSVINSFCHIHTFLQVTVVRSVLGFVIGIAFGLLCIAVIEGFLFVFKTLSLNFKLSKEGFK